MAFKLPFGKKANSDQPNSPIQSMINAGQPAVVLQPEVKPKVINPNLAIAQGMSVLDAIAPQEIEEDFDYIKINDVYFRTVFVGGYPRFVAPGWLEPVVNFDSSLDISFYVYPVDGKSVLDDLRRKIAEMEAELRSEEHTSELQSQSNLVCRLLL